MRNYIQLIGRLTKDPEKASINILVKSSMVYNKTKDQSFFIDIQAWDKSANALLRYKKGDLVLISGSLDIQTWDDKNGGKRSKAIINVNYSIKIPKDDDISIPDSNNTYKQKYTIDNIEEEESMF
jgi:single-stranded DNA-binding protein